MVLPLALFACETESQDGAIQAPPSNRLILQAPDEHVYKTVVTLLREHNVSVYVEIPARNVVSSANIPEHLVAHMEKMNVSISQDYQYEQEQ